jgi:hypothetical protein
MPLVVAWNAGACRATRPTETYGEREQHEQPREEERLPAFYLAPQQHGIAHILPT